MLNINEFYMLMYSAIYLKDERYYLFILKRICKVKFIINRFKNQYE